MWGDMVSLMNLSKSLMRADFDIDGWDIQTDKVEENLDSGREVDIGGGEGQENAASDGEG